MREVNREWMKGRNGISANAWKGDKAGYHAVHLWLSKHFSKPDACEQCGKKDFSRLEWANISGEYKRDISDYKALCPSCHRLMDIGDKCRKGHEYTPETTLINVRGHRWCLICKEQKYAKAN